MLYIVSTPIGNLGDITLRALETLKLVDMIAAEDTRHTGQLLKHFGISKPLTSFFTHNEQSKTDYIVGLLKEGKKVALVSDAGTPGIADPGFPLIRAVKEAGLPICVIPGPCAAIAGLSLSGLPNHEFVFMGFLPVKSGQRKKKLEESKAIGKTTIFYESPHRIDKTLQEILDVLGDIDVTIARELTKTFEESRTMKASQWLITVDQKPLKGEIVLLLGY